MRAAWISVARSSPMVRWPMIFGFVERLPAVLEVTREVLETLVGRRL